MYIFLTIVYFVVEIWNPYHFCYLKTSKLVNKEYSTQVRGHPQTKPVSLLVSHEACTPPPPLRIAQARYGGEGRQGLKWEIGGENPKIWPNSKFFGENSTLGQNPMVYTCAQRAARVDQNPKRREI